MATNLPTTEAMPAALAKYRREGFNKKLVVPASTPFGRISTDGKAFTFIFGEDSQTLKTTKGANVQYLDICVIDSAEVTSRAYWIGGYKSGTKDRPDCTSDNGVDVDPGVPHQQAKNCKVCPKSKFGSGGNGRSQACGSAKKLSVLPALDFSNERFGGPMLFRVMPGTFKNWQAYVKEQDDAGRDLNLIVTRMRYDQSVVHQKFTFQFLRWITEDEGQFVEHWTDSEANKRIIETTFADDSDGADAEDDVAPIAPPSTTASEKMAAAQAAARTSRKEQPAAKTLVAEEEEVEEEETAPLNVVPLKEQPKRGAAAVVRPATGTAKAVVGNGKAKPEPKVETKAPVIDAGLAEKKKKLAEMIEKLEKLDENSPLYNSLFARAEKMNEEIAAANRHDVVEEELTETAAAEEDDGSDLDEATTGELLAAIDDEDLSGVPD